MKKFATIALAVVLSMGILTGCGSSKKAAEATTEVKEETVDYGQGLDKEFRYLRMVIVTTAVYRGLNSPLRPRRDCTICEGISIPG